MEGFSEEVALSRISNDEQVLASKGHGRCHSWLGKQHERSPESGVVRGMPLFRVQGDTVWRYRPGLVNTSRVLLLRAMV